MDSAAERVRELMQAWSTDAREKLDADVERFVEGHQFAQALRAVREFEARFGTMAAAEGLEGVRQKIRMDARTALDALVMRVGPLITPKPREAHRLLIGVSHEFPADMASEVVVLLERCVARMMALSAKRRNTQPRNGAGAAPGKPEPYRGDPDLPPLPGPDEGPPEGPADGPRNQRAQARDAWAAARAEMLAGRYAEAVQGYTMLIQQFGNTAYYREHKSKITAGRRAAKVGALGPQGLVNVPATVKKGRIELEYQFNDQRVFEEDFTAEQPSPARCPSRCAGPAVS